MKAFLKILGLASVTMTAATAMAVTKYDCKIESVQSAATATRFSDAYIIKAFDCSPLNLIGSAENTFTTTREGAALVREVIAYKGRAVIATESPVAYGGEAIAIRNVELQKPDQGESVAKSVSFLHRTGETLYPKVIRILDQNGVAKIPYTSTSRDKQKSVQSFHREIRLKLATQNAELLLAESGAYYFRNGLQTPYVMLSLSFSSPVRGAREAVLSAAESANVMKVFALRSSDRLVFSGDSAAGTHGVLRINVENSIVTLSL